MARWENDNWTARHPDPEKIPCKDCAFKEADRMYKGEVAVIGATLSQCRVYPKGKPAGILFDGDDCEYHVEGSKTDEDSGS